MALRTLLIAVSIVLPFSHFSVPLTRQNPHPIAESIAKATPNGSLRFPWAGDLKNSKNFLYTGWITLGTPPQAFQLQFDTGSSFTWVGVKGCNGCPGKHLFDPSSSKTLEATGNGVQLAYGSGECEGSINIDVVGFGKSPDTFAIGQSFVLISNAEDFNGSMEGILGLAFSSLSNNYPTFVDNLQATGEIESRVFTVFLSTTDMDNTDTHSNITFGSLPFEYENAVTLPVTNSGYWSVSLGSVSVGGIPVQGLYSDYAIVDTGTSLWIVGTNEAYELIGMITQDYTECDSSSGLTVCLCDSGPGFPNVTVELGGMPFTIPPEAYVMEVSSQGQKVCGILIQGMDAGIGEGKNAWILGDVFIRAYYIQFDMDNMAMSFSQHPIKVYDGSSSSSFPRWAIAVIVIGVLLVLVVVGTVVFCVCRRRRKMRGGYVVGGNPPPNFQQLNSYQPAYAPPSYPQGASNQYPSL